MLDVDKFNSSAWQQVGVIGNLVHSSVNIKKEVLAAGALQPVIGLLRYKMWLRSCQWIHLSILLGTVDVGLEPF